MTRRFDKRALVLAPFSASGLESLRESLDVSYESWLDTRRLYDPTELASRLRRDGMAILVVEADFVFEEVFEATPDLSFLGVCRGGLDHVDVDAATRHGVLVVNTPGRNASAVAEHALGLMLALARHIPKAHRYLTSGEWQDPVEPYMTMRGVELAGRTLGVIGLGAIGRRLAAITSAVGMTVLAHDPYVTSPPRGITHTELDELLAQSDFVAISAPLSPETEGLIDARRLGLMKPSAYIVSLSAAAIVSEEALVAALRQRQIAGLAMDVFETHPISPNSPLLSLNNVVLTPHLGGATDETVARHSKMMADDIRRFCAGRRPQNLVNPDAWKSRG